ncbi:MAG: glycosyltransferase family 2 protein [Roseibium sp.]
MENVSVAIASIGRETLLGTLRSLAGVAVPDGVSLDVLVADDSADGAATRLVASEPPGRLSVTCLPVASGNIATARNALLDSAGGDWLIFVDDDEWVEADWLEKLLACQKEFNADVVIGPVRPDYPEETPAWLRRANPLYVDWGHRGKRLPTGRGGNTLVRTRLFRDLGLRFDEAYGRTGGEDTVFFAEAARKGARIFATDDAVAHEHIPAERLDPGYILRRGLRSGQSYGEMCLAGSPGLVRQALFALGTVSKCAVAGGLSAVLRPIDRARSFRMRQKLALNTGKLRAVFGLPLAELYSRPDHTNLN